MTYGPRNTPPDQRFRIGADQVAIPWCTTHDNGACYYNGAVYETGCWTHDNISSRSTANWPDCVISQGGPDHKWWKDT